jgi:hypothetical protein
MERPSSLHQILRCIVATYFAMWDVKNCFVWITQKHTVNSRKIISLNLTIFRSKDGDLRYPTAQRVACKEHLKTDLLFLINFSQQFHNLICKGFSRTHLWNMVLKSTPTKL